MCFPRKDGSPPGGLPFQPPVEPAVCLLTVLIVVFGSISTQGPNARTPAGGTHQHLDLRLAVAVSSPGIAPLKIFCSEFLRLISSNVEENFGHFLLTFSQTEKGMQEELVTKE